MTKTKEQLEEEKKISLSIRIKPLELDGMDSDGLKDKVCSIQCSVQYSVQSTVRCIVQFNVYSALQCSV